ncbi:hypothetical protein FM042_00710 [Aliidiomarina halalkaliphila]|uniref:Uncharacterized protein n=1 Tax=Aliidiomarina halalkaliphila TaxID=2593535 RepID=A0A552X388_9GAMM|nr:hypothetical protein [Aliidiomarina halalkaliphila]TRW49426.1 hypothetical protein FM042_00710 [Aliidiomarina halalkaliphila]
MISFRDVLIVISTLAVSSQAWASVPVLENYPRCDYNVLSELSETEQATWRSRSRAGYVAEPKRDDFQPLFEQAKADIQAQAAAINASGIILTRVERTVQEVSGTQTLRLRVQVQAQLIGACEGSTDETREVRATPYNAYGERQQRATSQTIAREGAEVDLSALRAQLAAERADSDTSAQEAAHAQLLAHSEHVSQDDVIAALRALELNTEQGFSDAGVTALQNLPLLNLSQPQDFEQSYAVSLWLSFTMSGDQLSQLYVFPQHPDAPANEFSGLLRALNIPTTADGIDEQFRNVTWGMESFTVFSDHFTLEGQLDTAASTEPVTQISIQFHPRR